MTETVFPGVAHTLVGGVSIARLDLEQTARLMVDLAKSPPRALNPMVLTSANGEVLARRCFDPEFAKLIDEADLVSADGQALIFASRLLSRDSLPERVATTDLYPVVARMAQEEGLSFHLFGASEAVNLAAYTATRRAFPRLEICGRSHGYLAGEDLLRKLAEINDLAPDILWLALGVPLEQTFVHRYAHLLPKVKVIKTSGGLFDFIAGAKPRAPMLLRKLGLEWAFRLSVEPRRLMWRYLTTNPVALFALLTRTK